MASRALKDFNAWRGGKELHDAKRFMCLCMCAAQSAISRSLSVCVCVCVCVHASERVMRVG